MQAGLSPSTTLEAGAPRGPSIALDSSPTSRWRRGRGFWGEGTLACPSLPRRWLGADSGSGVSKLKPWPLPAEVCGPLSTE